MAAKETYGLKKRDVFPALVLDHHRPCGHDRFLPNVPRDLTYSRPGFAPLSFGFTLD